MEGDVILVEEHHRRAASRIATGLRRDIRSAGRPYTITIAGESGSGKSESAQALREALQEDGMTCVILQQDDYFALPPKANDRHRHADLEWVGPQEVSLALLDSHLKLARAGARELVKPLVIYDADEIHTETVALAGVDVVIAEGTYTTLLEYVDSRVFIDRTREDTLETRRRRGREEMDEFLEQVLQIEHTIISSHRSRADTIITRDYDVRLAGAG